MSRTLFVTGYPLSTIREEIEAMFADWGKVEQVTTMVKMGKSGREIGFAFVAMAEEDDARRAKFGLNGSRMGVDGNRLIVDWAKPKSQRDPKALQAGEREDDDSTEHPVPGLPAGARR